VVQPVGMERLDVLTSGTVPPNPNELLGSLAMEELLEEATMRYDIVIIDAAPMLPVTDAAVLSQFVGGVVVVAESERVRRAEIDRWGNWKRSVQRWSGSFSTGSAAPRAPRMPTGMRI